MPLAGFGAIYLHHRHVPAALRPWRGVTVALWLCTAVMAAAAVYAVIVTFAA